MLGFFMGSRSFFESSNHLGVASHKVGTLNKA